jgi:hypothetical protein
MTSKPPLTRSTTAYPGVGVTVRLAAGIRCRCGREIQASDFDVDVVDLRVHAICQGCHQDVLAVDTADVASFTNDQPNKEHSNV